MNHPGYQAWLVDTLVGEKENKNHKKEAKPIPVIPSLLIINMNKHCEEITAVGRMKSILKCLSFPLVIASFLSVLFWYLSKQKSKSFTVR